MNVGPVLSASATPVVLISACGLITLALYNRLATILARWRLRPVQGHEPRLDPLLTLRPRDGVWVIPSIRKS